MAETFYQGDTGLKIELDCGRDISTATNRVILVRKPRGGTTTWLAGVESVDGVARLLTYTTVAGDLSEDGTYHLQASMTLGDWTGRGKTAAIVVLPLFS